MAHCAVAHAEPIIGTTVDNSELQGEWGDWMEAQGYAERTQELYTYAIQKFLSRKFTRGRNLLELGETQIVAHLSLFKVKAHSKAMHRRGLRCFYRWATRRGYLERDPTAILDRPRLPRRKPPAYFTREELSRLVVAAARRDEKRAWAILACYGLGLRRSELVHICPETDIDWTQRLVHIRHAKGDKDRDVPMGELAETALRELLPYSNGHLLPIQPSTLNEWVKQAARDCGIADGAKKQRAHTLRSSFATDLLRSGVNPAVVQRLLGHESLATTTVYAGVYPGDGAAAVMLLDETRLVQAVRR